MRAVIQRVRRAAVMIGGQAVSRIERGLLVLLGVGQADEAADARWLAEKIAGLRVFEDADGKMNRDVTEVGGALLVVSQFTLYADCRKGRRPSFTDAAPPEKAVLLYEQFIQAARERGIEVQTGQFGADMNVELVNDGPVTLVLESRE